MLNDCQNYYPKRGFRPVSVKTGPVDDDDSREELSDDCTLPPTVYCGKYGIEGCEDDADFVTAMCSHVALRASKITHRISGARVKAEIAEIQAIKDETEVEEA